MGSDRSGAYGTRKADQCVNGKGFPPRRASLHSGRDGMTVSSLIVLHALSGFCHSLGHLDGCEHALW